MQLQADWIVECVDCWVSPWCTCSCCGKTSDEKKFPRCKRCKRVAYCSKECQKKHWKAGHKKDCVRVGKGGGGVGVKPK